MFYCLEKDKKLRLIEGLFLEFGRNFIRCEFDELILLAVDMRFVIYSR